MTKYLLLCLLWISTLWAQEQEPLLMAVIDVQLQGDAKKYMNEQERRYLSTAIRAQASRILGTQVEILAQDKFKKLVKVSGEGCSEAGCLAGFFKEIGVDLGVQPTVSYAFGELKLLLEAADKRASLASRVYSAQANEKGKNLMGKQVERLAEELFTEVAIKLNLRTMGGGGDIEAIPDPKPRPTPELEMDEELFLVKFNSEPSGATVKLDNARLCETPCSKSLSAGKRSVSMSKTGYTEFAAKFSPSRTNNELSLTLQAQVASLVLTAVQGDNDVAAEIWVDGKQVGNTPKTVKVPLVGQVEVRFEGENQRVSLGGIAEGQKQAMQVEFTAKPKAGTGMVAIPAGCFNMGSNDWSSYEKPVHRVCLSAFSMDKYEVTQGEYERVMGSNPSDFSSCGSNCPVENVDWDQSSDYCRKVGKRLPTEAEWEYATRAGTTTKWYCGNDESCLDRIAWYDGNSGSKTHPVGQKQPNAWGLYDMAGNVWEWTSDWHGNYGSSSQQDPRGASSGSSRVYRGGSWLNFLPVLRSVIRSRNVPGDRGNFLGFRCVAPVSK